MIQIILQKCLDELAKDNADLSYIKGMLEVLLATQPQIAPAVSTKYTPVATVVADEASILDAKARAALETVKALGGKTE